VPIWRATFPRRRHFILEPTHSGMQRQVETLSSARKQTRKHATETPGLTPCQQEFNDQPLVINLQLTLPRKYLASKTDRTSPANDTRCSYPAWHSTTAVLHTWHTCPPRLWDPSLAAYIPDTTLSNFDIFGARTSTPKWRSALDDRRLSRLLSLHVCWRSCRTCKELRVLTQEVGAENFICGSCAPSWNDENNYDVRTLILKNVGEEIKSLLICFGMNI
jgi:hypothetical protein